MSSNWIRGDSGSGGSFCEITEEGERKLAAASGNDPDRVAFAARALTVDLHQALRNRHVDSHFRNGRFETALRDSSAFIEAEILRLSGLPAGTIGVQLAEQAFAASKGKLADPGVQPGQATGLQRLFMGYFGAVRNLMAHTEFRYADPKEAFRAPDAGGLPHQQAG
jgi:Protein of unknown function (Hypoth_ymh)